MFYKLAKALLDSIEFSVVGREEAVVEEGAVIFTKYVIRLNWFGRTFERHFYECFRRGANRSCLSNGQHLSFEEFQAEIKSDPESYGV